MSDQIEMGMDGDEDDDVNEDEELDEESSGEDDTAEERESEKLEHDFASEIPEAPPVGPIPFDLIKRHDKKTVRLVTNSGTDSVVPGKSIWFKYEFEGLVFLESIWIKCQEYSEYEDFEFYVVSFDEDRVEWLSRPKNGAIRTAVNRIVSEFGFRPPRRKHFKTEIKSVALYGFSITEADSYGRYVDNLDELRNDLIQSLEEKEAEVNGRIEALEALEEQQEELEAEVKALEQKRTKQQTEIEKLAAQRAEVVARIESLNQSVRQNDQQIAEQKLEIGRASETRSKLAKSIIDKTLYLKSLNENINLFPSELSSFVSQGTRDVYLYAALSAIPITVIAVMFYVLVNGGVELSTKITGEEDINIAAMMLSRIPFVIVAVTVITACYYLARMFILEMVRVNRQKLSLAKIGIIAKDVSYSIENELDMTDEEKYDRRLRLKMDMLRDHLKEYLSRDFQPSLPKRATQPRFKFPPAKDKPTSPATQAAAEAEEQVEETEYEIQAEDEHDEDTQP